MPDYIDYEQKLPEILGSHDHDLKPYHEIRGSTMGYCERRMLTSKLGVNTYPDHVGAAMFLGTGIHKALQDDAHYEDITMLEFEGEVSQTYEGPDGGLTKITGHYDARDEHGTLYDYKTTAGLGYVEDGPQDHHVDQLQTYLNLADTDRGELVYIQNWINKDDDAAAALPVVQHTVDRDTDYFHDELVPKAHRVRAIAEDIGPILDKYDVVYEGMFPEPCDEFFCRNEALDEDRVMPHH